MVATELAFIGILTADHRRTLPFAGRAVNDHTAHTGFSGEHSDGCLVPSHRILAVPCSHYQRQFTGVHEGGKNSGGIPIPKDTVSLLRRRVRKNCDCCIDCIGSLPGTFAVIDSLDAPRGGAAISSVIFRTCRLGSRCLTGPVIRVYKGLTPRSELREQFPIEVRGPAQVPPPIHSRGFRCVP